MKHMRLQQGQTLITLLFFMIIAISVISTAVILLITNSRTTSKTEQGIKAYYVAESGAENAILRLLRNPNYAGETLVVGEGTATMTVTGTEPKTITSTGVVGNFTKKIQVVVGYTNNILTVSSWREVQ